ncbi:MAG: hypothetical protein LVS60_12300 [Nodosilinea sp. LVE1205-7]
MKYPVLGGLTIAVTLAAFGAHSPVRAQDARSFSPFEPTSLLSIRVYLAPISLRF